MINNTFELLWRDISPFSVGFDRTIDTLSLLANSKQTSNYPPYNIRKISEEQYTIEVAVAGFEESEIDIEAVAEKTPELIFNLDICPKEGLTEQNANEISDNLNLVGIARENMLVFIRALYDAFEKSDSSLFEINPVLKTSDNKILAVCLLYTSPSPRDRG